MVVWEHLQVTKPGKVTKKDDKLSLKSVSVDTWMDTVTVYSLGTFFPGTKKGDICNDVWKVAFCINYQHSLEIIRNG